MKPTLSFPIATARGRFDGALLTYPRATRIQKIRIRLRHTTRPVYARDGPCACQCIAQADHLWASGQVANKDEWRAAVRRPALSGYNLWMKECFRRFFQDEFAPAHPGPSGGWSDMAGLPGTLFPPPDPDVKPWKEPDPKDNWELEYDPPHTQAGTRYAIREAAELNVAWGNAWSAARKLSWTGTASSYRSTALVTWQPATSVWRVAAHHRRIIANLDLTNLPPGPTAINFIHYRPVLQTNYPPPWSGLTDANNTLLDTGQTGVVEFGDLRKLLGSAVQVRLIDYYNWGTPPPPSGAGNFGSFVVPAELCPLYYGHR